MTAREKVERYLRVLELDPGASLREIHNAYLHLRKLYSEESIVLAPFGKEFSDEDKNEILRQIEEAYAGLIVHKSEESSGPERPSGPAHTSGGSGSGAQAGSGEAGPRDLFLKTFREKAEVDLERISADLKLRLELLKNLEEERFDRLPEEAFLRSHVKAYALILGLDPSTVVEEYLKRHAAWKKAQSSRGT
jgi:hypothetical protein